MESDLIPFSPTFLMILSSLCFVVLKYCTQLSYKTSRDIKAAREWIGLIHATIASVLSSTAFLTDPKLFEDLVNNSNAYAYACIAVTGGYFLGDIVMLLMEWKFHRNVSGHDHHLNINILMHHLAAFGVGCFSIWMEKMIGFSTLWISMEISSIFLKLRKIWKIMEWGTVGDSTYNFLAILNLVAFVVFRFVVIIYFTFWWFVHIQKLPVVFAFIPLLGCVVVVGINMHYFHLLIKSDVLQMIANTKVKI